MKKLILLSVLIILSVCVITRTNQRECSRLVKSNVEALSFNEWGGGNDIGDTHYWYEYWQTEYHFMSCGEVIFPGDTLPFPGYTCECAITTCHGYGDRFCNGTIVCY